jgi:hypothetical protein
VILFCIYSDTSVYPNSVGYFLLDNNKGVLNMGSAGSGRFGTYRIESGQITGGNGNDGVGGGIGEFECPSNIENIPLEDVATSQYYVTRKSLPSSGDPVELNNTIYRGRLVVMAVSTGEILGNLPTQYNYLINCIKKGMQYSGSVVLSGSTLVPFVVVTLHA